MTSNTDASKKKERTRVKTLVPTPLERLVDDEKAMRERVIKELMALAFSDPSKAYQEDGTLKPLADWPADLRLALTGIDVEVHGGGQEAVTVLKRVKATQKVAALDQLSKMFGLYTTRVEHTGKLSLESLIASSMQGE